jgi:hexosaminidase
MQGDEEAYDLEVGPNGVVVVAAGDAGLYYGAETLWQLLSERTGRAATITVADVRIHDAPRFAWRGLLLDSARHFQSPELVDKLIDEMALHKLNVLQWHLTDDQGWRLEIKKFPRLTQVGAWRTPAGYPGRQIDPVTKQPHVYGGFYTQDEVRAIVAYAAARHITIVPEIDVPGHASAAIAAYPTWGSTANPPKQPPEDWGVIPNLYNPNETTIADLQDVLTEVMALFPSRFIHMGGDEAVKGQWKSSPEVQARMKALGIDNEEKLQGWFIGRMDAFLAAHGRRLIGWDEILDGGVSPGATIMSWRGTDGAIAAAKAGHDTVLSPAPILYLDNRQSAAADEPPGRGYVLDLKQVYGFDPAPSSLTPAEQMHILGVQANLWTEHVRTDERVEHMAFPRAAAVAEIAWSPAKGRDFDDFSRREAAQLDRDHAIGFASADSAYEPRVQAEQSAPGRAKLELSNDIGFGQLRYTLDGSAPTPASPAYETPIETALPARLRVRTFDGVIPAGDAIDQRIDVDSLNMRVSQELKLCTEKVSLDLEDDAPLRGARADFLVDIMNPCWIWPKADLDGVKSIVVAVGHVPFNFQFGDEAMSKVQFAGDAKRPVPATPEGELQVRLDSCDSPPVATIPLASAAATPGVSSLPAAAIGPVSGRHDVCFTFVSRGHDPLWAIDRVHLLDGAQKPAPTGPAASLRRLFTRAGGNP